MAESNAGAIELGLKMQTMTVEQPEQKSKKVFTNPFKHFKSYTIPFSKEDLCSTLFNLLFLFLFLGFCFLFFFLLITDRNLGLMLIIVH